MSTYRMLPMLAGALAMLGGLGLPDQPKQSRKCLLKDCQRSTTHNGGYCCADHCRKDRERRKLNERKEAKCSDQ
jgi:hypothetical protein